MNDRQAFFNSNQTQTLTALQFMLYFRAVFLLLAVLAGGANIYTLTFLILAVGGAYGTANEKKWGYYMAAGFAVLNGLFYAYLLTASSFEFSVVLGALFAIVFLVLVFHEESRNYVKIWFK